MNPDIELISRILAGEIGLPTAVETSPLARALGMQVASIAPVSAETITLFAPADTFVQGAGVLQGGALAAMLDFAMIVPVMAAVPDAIPATTNLDTVFYRPAPPGLYEARARIRRRTRQVVFVEATLSARNGDEVAAASATVFVRTAAQQPGR